MYECVYIQGPIQTSREYTIWASHAFFTLPVYDGSGPLRLKNLLKVKRCISSGAEGVACFIPKLWQIK